MRRLVPAGLVDAGFAALATFAVTIYGARVMPEGDFGFFAIYWAAFLMAAIVPAQFVFQPWEVAAARLRPRERVSFLRRAIRAGVVVAFAAGIASSGVALLMTGIASPPLRLAFGLTLILAATLSPVQDYIRRMLHLAERSPRAAVVSFFQFVAVVIAIWALSELGVSYLWVPFVSLTIANVVSSMVGVVFLRGSPSSNEPSPARAEILRSGSWLLIIGLIAPLAGLLVNWIVLVLAGEVTLGLAEAARIVGRPVLVVTTGLGLALRPRSYAAASRGDEPAARRVRRVFIGVTVAVGITYAAAVGIDWRGNPMAALVPNAYEIAGLVAAVCVANTLVGVSFPARYEMIAKRREGYTTGIELIGQTLKTATAGLAGPLGGFVIPLGDAVLGMARAVGLAPKLKRLYSSDP